MVLEGATRPSEPSDLLYDSPPSDGDPYADASSDSTPLYLDLSRIPLPLFVRNDELMIDQIRARILRTQELLRRPLTQQEVNALAYYQGRGTRIASFGIPIGLAGGLYCAYRYPQAPRFPFGSMDAKGLSNFFASYGKTSHLAWHVFRVGAFGTAGLVLSISAFSTYATFSNTYQEMKDPRLKNVTREFTNLARSRRAGQQPSGPTNEHSGPKGWGDDDNDASPTSRIGYDNAERQVDSTAFANDAKPPFDTLENMDDDDNNNTTSLRSGQNQQRQQQQRRPRMEASSSSTPSAGREEDAGQSEYASAWDRLRSQAARPAEEVSSSSSSSSSSSHSTQEQQPTQSTPPPTSSWADRRRQAIQQTHPGNDEPSYLGSDVFGLAQQEQEEEKRRRLEEQNRRSRNW